MSAERFTLDTNILIYSIQSDAGAKRMIARKVIDLAVRRDCRLTLQAVSEFFAAATRKRLMPVAEAAAQASDWMEMFPCLSQSAAAVRTALLAASGGRTSYWDALLIATAAEGGCAAILTEDMADGAMIEGVRVVNPFDGEALSAGALRMLSGTARG